jgi:hypothetical protein
VSRVLLFWAAFILARPLGATVGDLRDKPVANGGLALSRPWHRRIHHRVLICPAVTRGPAPRSVGRRRGGLNGDLFSDELQRRRFDVFKPD